MKLIKQYPYISSLLIFSIFWFLVGVYVAFVMPTGKRIQPHYTYGKGSGTTTAARETDKPAVTVIKQVRTAKSSYYSYLDKTVNQIEYLPLHKVGSSELTMVAYFEREGFTLRVPDKISFRLVVMSKDYSYTQNLTFRFFLDGKLFINTKSKFEGSQTDKGIVSTSLNQEIPYPLFVKISQAKKVRLQVGNTFFKLKENDIQSFRDLVELVETKTTTTEEAYPLSPYPYPAEKTTRPVTD